MFWKRGLFCLVHLFIFISTILAVEVNRTIDDTLGDSITGKSPSYLPASGVWENASCKNCVLQPDGILAFKGTWAAATYDPGFKSTSIDLNFKGTAIYIFFILADIIEEGLVTETACNFTLDGQPAGNFTHTPAANNEFLYNSLVFSRRDLLNTDHNFTISTSGLNRRVWVNFDYAIYTADDTPSPSQVTLASPIPPSSPIPSPSASPSLILPPNSTTTQSASLSPSPSTTSASQAIISKDTSHVAAIAGGIVGGFIFFFVILFLFFVYHRRRKDFEGSESELPEAVMPTSSKDVIARFITPFVDRRSPVNRGSPIDPVGAYDGVPTGAVGPSTMTAHRFPHNYNTGHQPWSPTLMPESGSGRFVVHNGTGEGPTRYFDPLAPFMASANTSQDQINSPATTASRRRTGLILAESRGQEAEIFDMKEQIRVMKEHIAHLQMQQQTLPVPEPSVRLPPNYTTRHPSVRR